MILIYISVVSVLNPIIAKPTNVNDPRGAMRETSDTGKIQHIGSKFTMHS